MVQDTATVPETSALPAAAPFYITGGTLPPEASSYVTRQADTDLLNALRAGDYCYVLNSRQMGKSSLCVRTTGRLQQAGIRTVFVDLTKLGGSNLSAEQWYAGMLSVMGRELGLRGEFLSYWKVQAAQGIGPLPRLFGALEEVALSASDTPLVVFVDEIDATRSLPFSVDEFFGAIRQLYVERATNPALKRIAFCLLGTAAPSDLIQDTRVSPFNIGRRVEVTDFTAAEAAPLAKGLNHQDTKNTKGEKGERGKHGEHGGNLLERVLYWTNGHPYLTQRLCSAIVEAQTPTSNANSPQRATRNAQRLVDSLCADLFLTHTAKESDNNLTFVRDRLLKGEAEVAAVLDLYGQVRDGKPIADDDTNPLCAVLKLSGIARVENGLLRVRNRIYAQVFDRKWVADHTSDAELRRQATAYRRGVQRTLALAGVILAVFSGVLAYAFRQRNDARHNAQLANNKTLEAKRAFDDADYNLYVANMNLIQRDWDNGNVTHALELLEATRTRGKDTFEWGYWHRLCHLERMTLKGHKGTVQAVAWSPDGTWIATGGEDRTVRMWDAATGNCRHILKWHSDSIFLGYVSRIVFSLNGTRLLTCSNDGVRLWDVTTGNEQKSFKTSPDMFSAAFSPDGMRIVTTNMQAAIVRDVATGKELLALKASGFSPTFVAFSPDGKRILTASANKDQAIRVWDASTGKALLLLRGNIQRGIFPFACSSDGKHIAAGMNDHTVKLWDARTGKAQMTLTGHTDAVADIAFSPAGRQLATGGNDGTAKVWDVRTGKCLLTLTGHAGAVNSVAFSPDNKRLVSCGDNGTKVWDATAEQNSLTLMGNAGNIVRSVFSPDGRRIVTLGDKGSMVWDVSTGKKLITRKLPVVKDYPLALSSDGSHVTVMHYDHGSCVVTWDSTTGNQQRTFRGGVGVQAVESVVFSPDGNRIAVLMTDAIIVMDAATGKELLTIKRRALSGGAFSPDGRQIAAASSDNTVSVWDLATGQEKQTFRGHEGIVIGVAFSSDGKRIATGSYDQTAKIWDKASGRCLLTLKGHTRTLNSVTFSSDGKRLLTSSEDKTAKVWDAATGADLLTLKGHTDSLNSAVFSPDGKRIVTGSDDGTAKV